MTGFVQNEKIYVLSRLLCGWERKCIFMLESRERNIEAGIDGKTIEKLHLENNNLKIAGCNLQKINCWDFVGCKRGSGGERAAGSGMCRASLDASAEGINHGKNGGRICWAISGTFSGEKIDGLFAKKLLSCRSCKFFKSVKNEEGGNFSLLKNQISEQAAEAVCEG